MIVPLKCHSDNDAHFDRRNAISLRVGKFSKPFNPKSKQHHTWPNLQKIWPTTSYLHLSSETINVTHSLCKACVSVKVNGLFSSWTSHGLTLTNLLPISLIRHSYTHIRWSPFCFTHWMAGCSSMHHKNSYAKTSSFERQGKPSEKNPHTWRTLHWMPFDKLLEFKW